MAGVASFGSDQPSMRRPQLAQKTAFSGSSALQCGQRTSADIGWRDRSMLRYDMTMNQILDHVLGAARQLGASDVHLKAGLPPVFRIKGDLRTVRDTPPLTARGHRHLRGQPDERPAARDLREAPRRRPLVRHARRRALPRQRLPAARADRHGPAHHPARGAAVRQAQPAVGRAATCAKRSAGSSWSPASPARASRRRWRR